ncbi:MAG TPA: hypothetical protein VHO68_10720 [Bacteroidales bacterium]|nr:hypothetical protein [Bacteroidales bacterium]
MIEEQVKIHDKFSLEIKLGFLAREQNINEFSVSTWIFIPNSLDINRWNYEKKDFYKDLKSNIRLITPVYTLEDIADEHEEPYRFLREAVTQLALHQTSASRSDYEYHIRMFVSIIKSALREEVAFITGNQDKDHHELTDNYIRNSQKVASLYRSLKGIIDKPGLKGNLLNYYLFGDEFMSNLIEQHSFKLIEGLKKKRRLNHNISQSLMELIQREINYKKENGLLYVEKNSRDKNRELVFRLSLLKKYAENELFLDVRRRRDGVWVEQIYFSIAAGISMIFATAIAFSIQKQYGNLTMPFFVALVISYMLKDRLKELARYYLAHRWGRRFFDNKTDISLNEHNIGWHKEGMDFISERKVPAEVIRIRKRSSILEAENRNNKEQIILYRKLVKLKKEVLEKVSPYPTAGMNDIIRFNVSNYIQKMDNPEVPLYVPEDDGTVGIIKGEKMYYINFIMQLRHSDGVHYKRYRVVMNRKGIREVETFEL